MSEKALNKKISYITYILIIAALGAGFLIGRRTLPAKESTAGTVTEPETIWTCSMHPQIRQKEPGKCPLCGMDLIPLSEEEKSKASSESVLSFSPEAVKLMEVQTTPVVRKPVEAEIRLVGKLDYDQTRIKEVTAWASGRIDRLYVDYTGMQVQQGDHMVELYSPALISAQAELLQALQSVQQNGTTSSLVKQSIEETLQAARDKLRLLGVNPEQIETIESTGKILDHLTIYSPIGGVVIDKAATEGMYVQTGSRIYSVADLSKLWVMLDAYESDLSWIRYGQEIEFTTEAYPGEIFKATVSFIAPVLNEKTRTAKVRAVVDNPGGKLKPELFVRAVVLSPLSQNGHVMAPSMADKWICPMHQDVIKDHPGLCDICGMDLVKASSLYQTADTANMMPLAVPASAVLVTGRKLDRAVVYVQVEGADKPTFVGREVVLGPKAGDEYVILEGLMEGERVVTNGNFKIDSAMQIQAKPSLMTVSMEPKATEQTLCPVMDGPIDKRYFVEYRGRKVYFCCPGCEDTFLKDPGKYLSKLPQFQNQVESADNKMEHAH